MEFYLFVFLLCVLGMYINPYLSRNKKRIFELLFLIILCLISGTRYKLGGTDYFLYELVYDNLPGISDFLSHPDQLRTNYLTFGWEWGYLFLNSLSKSCGFSFYGFTFIHSVLFYSCMYIGLKRYIPNFNLLLVIFLYKLFFYETFVAMRQSLTIAIFFISLKYIEEKKPLKYYLLSVLAFTIHHGAALLFLAYFVNMLKLSKKKLILLNCIFIPTIVISFLHIPVLQYFDFAFSFLQVGGDVTMNKVEDLINSDFSEGINMFHALEYFLIMFFLILNFDIIQHKYKHADFIVKLFLFLLPLFTLLRGYAIFTREKDYFVILYAIILYYLSDIKQARYRQIVFLSVTLICGFGFIRYMLFFDGGSLLPYISWLSIRSAHLFN